MCHLQLKGSSRMLCGGRVLRTKSQTIIIIIIKNKECQQEIVKEIRGNSVVK